MKMSASKEEAAGNNSTTHQAWRGTAMRREMMRGIVMRLDSECKAVTHIREALQFFCLFVFFRRGCLKKNSSKLLR